MKIINNHNFLPLVCISFTGVTLTKIVIEALFFNLFENYQVNLLTIILFCTLTILVLSLHPRIFMLPLFLAVFIQYLSVVLSMMFFTWIIGFIVELAQTAYRDMFISTSIFYFVISGIYYLYFNLELKRHNLILKQLKQFKENSK